jgi:hypothetical protein
VSKICFHTVTIALSEEDGTIARIQGIAAVRGTSFESVLSDAVNIGLWNHINENLEKLEDCLQYPM